MKKVKYTAKIELTFDDSNSNFANIMEKERFEAKLHDLARELAEKQNANVSISNFYEAS